MLVTRLSRRRGRFAPGRFFDRTREARANAQAYDADARRELWRRSLELVGHPGID